MKKTIRAISLFMSVVLMLTAMTVGASAADKNANIYLPTGSTQKTAAEFAIGETVFGKADTGESFVYYFYNNSVADYTFKYRASALTSFAIVNALDAAIYSDKTSATSTSHTYKDLPAGGYYVTIANAETDPSTTEYSFAVCPKSYVPVYGELNKQSAELNSGETLQLTVKSLTEIPDCNTFWRIKDDPKTSVDESKFATITKEGLVKVNYPSSSNGFSEETYIKAQLILYYGYEEYKEPIELSCEILAKPANIILNPHYTTSAPYRVAKGVTAQISATTEARAVSDPSKKAKLDWSSSDETVVTVDKQGRITALQYGSADITVRIQETNIQRVFTVIVDKDVVSVTGISFDKASESVRVGKTAKLAYTFDTLPAGGTPTNKTVTFTSSDTSIATVDKNGNVKGIAEGTVTITVTSEDGKKTDTCEVTVKPALNPIIEIVLTILEYIVSGFRAIVNALKK